MKRFLLLVITGVIFCSSTSTFNDERLARENDISLICSNGDDGNVQNGDVMVQVSQGYNSLFSVEIWHRIIDFADFITASNLALVCRTSYIASKKSKSLPLKRMQKWIIQRIRAGGNLMLQRNFVFNMENAFLKLRSNWDKRSHKEVRNLLLNRTHGIRKLQIPSFELLLAYRDDDGIFIQQPTVKELILPIVEEDNIFYSMMCFPWIKEVFPNIDTLQLNLDFSAILPTVDYVLAGLPTLKKLIIRVVDGCFDSREDFISILEILQDERLVLKFEKDIMDSKFNTAVMALDLFDSKLKEQDEIHKMKQRTFFHIKYGSNIPEIIYENSKQIHSMEFEIFDTINDFTRSNLRKFTQVEKFNVTNYCRKARSAHSSLSKLLAVFPNVSELKIYSKILPSGFWSEVLKLKNLEKFVVAGCKVEEMELVNLIKKFNENALPKLKLFRLPPVYLNNSNKNNVENFMKALKKLFTDNPLIEYRYYVIPKFK